MLIPLNVWDLSLLTAALCIILLVTFAFFMYQSGKIVLLLNMERIRNSAIMLALVLASILVRVISLV
jgi:hypothetical protein